MKWLLCMMWAGLAFSQCTVLIQPYPLAATERIFANGHEAGLWKVVLRNHTAENCIATRQDVETLAPEITFFGTNVALDLLTRKANLSKWAVIARYGQLVLTLAPTAAMVYGEVRGVSGWTIGGASASVLQLFVKRATADAPNPAHYTTEFCGEDFKLVTGAGMDCYMAAGLVHGVRPLGPFELHNIVAKPVLTSEDFRVLNTARFFNDPRAACLY